MAAGYDPKKAATYNRLRQAGLSDDAAASQAGIVGDDAYNYVVNDIPGDPNRGTVGPVIFGSGTVSQAPTQAFEKVDYAVKADSRPSTSTPTNYVTTSTEQVSGGGSRTITASQPTANDTSRALQSQADAKTAELRQYLADNPRNGNYTPAQAAERREKIDSLVAERGSLASQAAAAETPGTPTETIVPNTTSNISTTTFVAAATNEPVQTVEGPDPALNGQTETFNTTTFAVTTDSPEAVPNDSVPGLLTPAESIARAQVTPADADPAAAAADFNANTNASVLGAIGVKQPAPVDTATGNASALTANTETTVVPARSQQEQEAINAAAAEQAAKQRAQQQAAIQAEFQTPANGDWRVRLRLAPGATYLYKDADNKLLAPLAASDGVVFPYMPSIGTTYTANYDQTDLVHSNYKGYFYRNSAVDAVSITGKFTAQDTFEATYMLAVIHFFRSVTKMFYGQDWQRGAPPPLVFLSGLGEYQFNNHPCVVNSFNYSLPADVDYIRTKPNNYNVDLSSRETKPISGPFSEILGVVNRLKNAALPKGAVRPQPEQGLVTAQSVNNTQNSTYVPTSIDITITLLPIQTRKQISQGFSVQEFSKGTLLRKGFW
jgi:hypothetical protein